MTLRVAMLLRTLAVMSSVTLLVACDPDDPCDPGYYADHGVCFRIDAGTSDEDAGGEDAAVDRYAGFGQACTTPDDCPATAPSCGRPPVQVCTLANCMELGEDACPPGWTCLDITGLSPDPAITSACVNL